MFLQNLAVQATLLQQKHTILRMKTVLVLLFWVEL